MGCQGLNLGWLRTRQAPSPLSCRSVSALFSILKGDLGLVCVDLAVS